MGNPKVPNWAQALIAQAADCDPDNLSVKSEDNDVIVFVQYLPHADIRIDKKTGEVRKTMYAFAESNAQRITKGAMHGS